MGPFCKTVVNTAVFRCLGFHAYKATVNEGQCLISSFVQLVVVLYMVLHQPSGRNIKRCSLGVRSPSGIPTVLLVSVVLLGCCSDTAAGAQNKDCSLSIKLVDEFGDLTSVVRIGGQLEVFCEGKGSKFLVYEGAMHSIIRSGEKGKEGQFLIPIGNHSEYWEYQKNIFTGQNFRCECGGGKTADKSPAKAVPHPVLCRAGSQHPCGDKEICSVDVKTGGSRCMEASKSHCGTAEKKYSTFLCPEMVGGYPTEECQNIKERETRKWPVVQIAENTKEMCKGT